MKLNITTRRPFKIIFTKKLEKPLWICEKGHVENGYEVDPIRCLRCSGPVRLIREVGNEPN